MLVLLACVVCVCALLGFVQAITCTFVRGFQNNMAHRAPDIFLKHGVADTSLEAKGVFLQNPGVFSLPSFYTRAFLEVANLVLSNRKNAAHNWSLNLPSLY